MRRVQNTLTLANILDDAAFLSLEHQLHLEDVLGAHNWSVDLQEQRFAFDGERPLQCTRFHLLGSAAPGPGSWLWAWANSSIPGPVTELSASLRDFGAKYGIAELADAEIPFDGLPQAQGDPNLVASVFLEAAKAITGNWTSYTGDIGGGTRAAFLIEHPDFRLPAPEPARVMRVLQQGLGGLRLHDHRRALWSYAQRRGLSAAVAPEDGSFHFSFPGFTATVSFDELNRVSDIKGTMKGQQQG
ncbi:DUF6882 domain-containing protein [Nocardiopsis potens]|uniref:DUF6882 domain-containing protein n=1 Tax=Nocardiopsis potens TaxID=1246458 RepID=UPI00034DCB11